jgi:prepilin-type N-terminal cleavage/methylation domain-containing protein
MMNKKGFTLIELLIVIALLGILALALIAAIDPFEQLKKGRDTGTRNSTEELYNSLLRYYAIRGKFPWTSSAVSSSQASDITNFIQQVIDAGELKQAFLDDTDKLGRIFVTSTHEDILDNMDDLTVCFTPESKAFRIDENTKFRNDGSDFSRETGAGPCPTTDFTGGTCYWCIE